MKELIQILQSEEVKKRLQESAVTHINIAGSYARGEQNEHSDIDLIVDVDNNKLGISYFSLPGFLSEKLGISVDLLDRSCINKHVKPHILSHLVSVW